MAGGAARHAPLRGWGSNGVTVRDRMRRILISLMEMISFARRRERWPGSRLDLRSSLHSPSIPMEEYIFHNHDEREPIIPLPIVCRIWRGCTD